MATIKPQVSLPVKSVVASRTRQVKPHYQPMVDSNETHIGPNLDALIHRAHVQKLWLASQIGVSEQAIQKWIKDGTIARSHIPKLCDLLDCSADELLGIVTIGPMPWSKRTGDNFSNISANETNGAYVSFPLVEGFAGMGKGGYIDDYPEVVENLRVSKEWVERKLPGIPPDAIRVLTGRGDSMRGQFNDGDLIFIDVRVKSFEQDSAYCFRWEGRVQIKRLQFVGRNTLRILSKNPDYQSIDVPMDEIEIGGRALAAWTLTEF